MTRISDALSTRKAKEGKRTKPASGHDYLSIPLFMDNMYMKELDR
jgi:hypothetical protein